MGDGMEVAVRFEPDEVTSEVDCNREDILHIDPIFAWHAGLKEDRSRGGWACTISLFILEDNFVLNEEVESEVAFITYNIGDDDVCEVVDMEVAEVLRGHGLGRRLVEEALADLKLKGASRVYLFAYEPKEGDRVTFFSSFGFEPIEVPDEMFDIRSLPNPMWLDLEDVR